MKEISTEIMINATPEQVWRVLADWSSYPAWNPLIKRISGPQEKGAEIRVRIQPPGERAVSFRPRLLDFEPGKLIRWKGRFLLPGLFEGEHTFEITPVDGSSVLFSHRETFQGLLARIFPKILHRTETGFIEMNRALKARAERVAGAA